jgi:hypothetical protein
MCIYLYIYTISISLPIPISTSTSMSMSLSIYIYRSAFRNGQFNGIDFVLTPMMFTPFPTSGKLSFDFLASDHPPLTAAALSDKRCISCLISLGLVADSGKSRAQDALNTWREYGVTTGDGRGKELPIADYNRAYAIQSCSNRFHNSLSERPDQLAKAVSREDVQAFRARQARQVLKRKTNGRAKRCSVTPRMGLLRKGSSNILLSPGSGRSGGGGGGGGGGRKGKSSDRMNSAAGGSAMLIASISEFHKTQDLSDLGNDSDHSDSDNSEDDYEEDEPLTPLANANANANTNANANGNANASDSQNDKYVSSTSTSTCCCTYSTCCCCCCCCRRFIIYYSFAIF